MSRLQDRLPRDGENRPHLVVCGGDALVYTLTEELVRSSEQLRITVVVPHELHGDVPPLSNLRGVRVMHAERLDERSFRAAGLGGAAALALVMPDDVINLHAALCAQAVEPDLRLVIRMFNTGLGYGVRRLFANCAVLSDAAMAAPAFVAAALGQVAPTHFRLGGRTLHTARRSAVSERNVVCVLSATDHSGRVGVLPDPAPPRPDDLVLAEAPGRKPMPEASPWRRPRRHLRSFGRAVRVALSRRLGIAVLITLLITAVAGAVLAAADDVQGFWRSLYVTLLTVVGSSDVEMDRNPVAQAAQLVLTLAGVALLPLITAAVVEGVVNARLALSNGRVVRPHSNHVVLVGLGTVGTGVLWRLNDLGVEVVAIDRKPDARGVKVAERLGVPFILGDAAREVTLRAASIERCRALLVVSTDDVTNLQAALNARAIRDDIRVVLRLFDDDFAQHVQTAFNINVSRSVSRTVAPAFAAAMLNRDALVTIPVERNTLMVSEMLVKAGSTLDGAPLSEADGLPKVRVIAMRSRDEQWMDWHPDPRRVLAAGDRVVVVARRAGLHALRAAATPPDSRAEDTA
ncbi:potassium transporter TrkA [Mangrovihabitans endophyticus]|uniref:Potassium transporter TrkA n=1 Tax=Mangrovihabitans endophyticus TaxID=1751298 RepID=A0A8J3BYW9_9ACTN|nr:potassium transporter TrkA [Mangrovihabitans endophyticus]